MSKILITGTGMDAPTLAELLLEQGHTIFNLKRRSGKSDISNLKKCLSYSNYNLVEGDITESLCVSDLIKKHQFDLIFNTAAQSHVKYSYDFPSLTFNVNVGGYLNILEAVRYSSPHTKVINFGSSEQFGNTKGKKIRYDILSGKSWVSTDFVEALDLTCEFKPESVYASSKVAAHHLTRNYRDSFGLWVAQPIMFNHEGKYRSPDFVTQKIIQYVAKLYRGETSDFLYLGNLDARRDWSDCEDFMRGLILIAGLDQPKDYVLASGEDHSVRDFLDQAFAIIGEDWNKHVKISEQFFRPTEVHKLLGNATEIRNELGWFPQISFEELIWRMFDYACPEFKNKGLFSDRNFTVTVHDIEDICNSIRIYQTS